MTPENIPNNFVVSIAIPSPEERIAQLKAHIETLLVNELLNETELGYAKTELSFLNQGLFDVEDAWQLVADLRSQREGTPKLSSPWSLPQDW